MTTSAEPASASRAHERIAALVIAVAAVVAYLSTLGNYFVRDDFGVVQLLASKPASYFPRWFYTSWMDQIWGFVPDEVRPFPAVSYQLYTFNKGHVAVVVHEGRFYGLITRIDVLNYLRNRVH